jgi:hypothetical protein
MLKHDEKDTMTKPWVRVRLTNPSNNNNKTVVALLDTGASDNYVGNAHLKRSSLATIKNFVGNQTAVRGVGGTAKGIGTVSLHMGFHPGNLAAIPIKFIVLDDEDIPFVIGSKFQGHNKSTLNFNANTWTIGQESTEFITTHARKQALEEWFAVIHDEREYIEPHVDKVVEPVVELQFGEIVLRCLVDTGSTISLVSKNLLDTHNIPYTPLLQRTRITGVGSETCQPL